MSTSPSPGAGGAVGRIDGIDIWRALLIGMGLFVHASFGLRQVAAFSLVDDLSQAFRMGALFGISGYLSAASLAHRPSRTWLLDRVRRLGAPAAFGIWLLSPLIWVAFATAGAVVTPRPLWPFEWYHYWFLVALLLYSVVAVVLDAIDRDGRLSRGVDRWSAGWGVRLPLLLVANAMALLLWLAGLAMRATMPESLLVPFATIQLVAGYLPMFVFGFMLARCTSLYNVMMSAHRFLLALVVCSAIALVAMRLSWGTGGAQAERIRFLLAVLCPPAAFVLILRSGMSIRDVPLAVRRVSEASYTIYILHLPIAALVNSRIANLFDPHLAYLVSVGVSGVGAFAVHRAILPRWRLFALLINGRSKKRAGASADQPDPDASGADQWTNLATTSR